MVGQTEGLQPSLVQVCFSPQHSSDRSLAPQGLSSSGDAQQAIGRAGCSGRRPTATAGPGCAVGVDTRDGEACRVCVGHVTCRAGNGSPGRAGST